MVSRQLSSLIAAVFVLIASQAGHPDSSTAVHALPVLQPRQASTSTGTFTTQGSNQCIDVTNDQLANGAILNTDGCSSSVKSQQWKFVASNVAGQQSVQSASGNFCLDVKDGAAANGTPVQVWQCNANNKNQAWTQNSSKQLQWNGSNYCLDIANGYNLQYPNGRPLQIWQCDANNLNQKLPFASSTVAPAAASLPGRLANTTGNRFTDVFDPNAKRMLAWGYDNSAAPMMGSGTKIGSYHHWEHPSIPQMPEKNVYVPTYWGITKKAYWQAAKADLGGKAPLAVMGFNEPDVPSQANMSPLFAAQEYYNEITKNFASADGKGTILISPSVAWDVQNWLKPFMNRCDQLGCQIDAVGYHIYLSLARDGGGSVDNLIKVIDKRVTTLYNTFKKPIVLGELGLTQAGGGSNAQMTEFMQKTAKYLDASPYVLSYALSAVFRQGQGWDNYLNSNLAFFDPAGGLTSMARQYKDQSF